MKMEKVSFMGQTMGGRVGMILALTQPQLFDKLICVDSTPRQGFHATPTSWLIFCS